MQGEAAGSLPGAVVDVDSVAEYGASPAVEHAPPGNHLGGGVADAGTAEVDQRAEPAIADEQIGPQQVGVDLCRLPVPRRCFEGAGPGVDRGNAVYHAPPRLYRLPRHGVELVQGPPPAAGGSDRIDAA